MPEAEYKPSAKQTIDRSPVARSTRFALMVGYMRNGFLLAPKISATREPHSTSSRTHEYRRNDNTAGKLTRRGGGAKRRMGEGAKGRPGDAQRSDAGRAEE